MFSFPHPSMPASAVDRGTSTAEYAMCTVAAVAFAGILYFVVNSDPVREAITSIIVNALQSAR